MSLLDCALPTLTFHSQISQFLSKTYQKTTMYKIGKLLMEPKWPSKRSGMVFFAHGR